jgi:large conductance mechanosensitive channel
MAAAGRIIQRAWRIVINRAPLAWAGVYHPDKAQIGARGAIRNLCLRVCHQFRKEPVPDNGRRKTSIGVDMISEFKAFIARGNVLDLAVGVIIGGAFATITKSLTEDIVMPIISAIFGGVDFTNKFILLGAVPDGVAATDYAKLKEAGVAMLGYGAFITAVINFLILAFAIFLIVRQANKMIAPAAEAPAGPSEVELLTEIRDALKK